MLREEKGAGLELTLLFLALHVQPSILRHLHSYLSLVRIKQFWLFLLSEGSFEESHAFDVNLDRLPTSPHLLLSLSIYLPFNRTKPTLTLLREFCPQHAQLASII